MLDNHEHFIQYLEASYPIVLPQFMFILSNPLTSLSREPLLRIRLTMICLFCTLIKAGSCLKGILV